MTDHKEPDGCPATSPLMGHKIPYACTLDKGHEGPHNAEGLDDQVFETWTDAPVTSNEKLLPCPNPECENPAETNDTGLCGCTNDWCPLGQGCFLTPDEWNAWPRVSADAEAIAGEMDDSLENDWFTGSCSDIEDWASRVRQLLATEGKSRKAIEGFVEDLFMPGGGGRTADRLVLWDDSSDKNLGGWTQEPICDRLEEFLGAPEEPVHETIAGLRVERPLPFPGDAHEPVCGTCGGREEVPTPIGSPAFASDLPCPSCSAPEGERDEQPCRFLDRAMSALDSCIPEYSCEQASAVAREMRTIYDETMEERGVVVAKTVGGLVDGQPTTRHNFLQRLRALVAVDIERAEALAKVKRLECEVGRIKGDREVEPGANPRFYQAYVDSTHKVLDPAWEERGLSVEGVAVLRMEELAEALAKVKELEAKVERRAEQVSQLQQEVDEQRVTIKSNRIDIRLLQEACRKLEPERDEARAEVERWQKAVTDHCSACGFTHEADYVSEDITDVAVALERFKLIQNCDADGLHELRSAGGAGEVEAVFRKAWDGAKELVGELCEEHGYDSMHFADARAVWHEFIPVERAFESHRCAPPVAGDLEGVANAIDASIIRRYGARPSTPDILFENEGEMRDWAAKLRAHVCPGLSEEDLNSINLARGVIAGIAPFSEGDGAVESEYKQRAKIALVGLRAIAARAGRGREA